ncbi:MAG TPA: hypothetical protein VLA66_12460 [Thermoanaerobaculia bacterium]|nr:hypothetical protein [Thermoanaerobaculia bacterium]
MLRRPAATLLTLLLPLLVACRPAEPPATGPTPPAHDNSELLLRLVELPEGMTVVASDAAGITLDATSDGAQGTVAITVGPHTPAGINLVGEAKRFGEGVAAAGGTYFGGNQLVTGYGSGYSIRVLHPEGAVEEIRVFLLHPADPDRLLEVSLGYPPGGAEVTNARMSQLLAVLGAIEPIDAETGG